MPNKIDSSLNPYRPVKGAGDSPRAREDVSSTANNANAAAGARQDTVELTGHARQMASLESAIASASGIDEARVEAIRTQVAAGTYTAQPQQIADGLVKMDQMMAGN